jgi:hypothetical protein
MNTKNPKYKEYLKLERELEAIDQEYVALYPEHKNSRGGCGVRFYYDSDNGVVVKVKSSDNTTRHYHIGYEYHHYEYSNKSKQLPYYRDMLAMGIMLPYGGFKVDFDSWTNKKKLVNLRGLQIKKSYIDKIDPRYWKYFKEKKITKKVNGEPIRNLVTSYTQIGGKYFCPWDKCWKHSKSSYETHRVTLPEGEFVTEISFKQIEVEETIHVLGVDLWVERVTDTYKSYHSPIFSDLEKRKAELNDRRSYLIDIGAVYRRGWCSRYQRQILMQKSRSVVKQSLRNALKYDNFDNIIEDFHNPHNDRWFYD